jgi:hypothetical protein
MSIHIMAQVWQTDLPPTERLVLLALADCANHEGECWPSIATLVRKTGASERTVQRALRVIEDRKMMQRVVKPGKGVRYFLDPRQSDTPADLTPPSECRPTPVNLTPHPRQDDTQTIIEPSRTVTVEAKASTSRALATTNEAQEPPLRLGEIVEAWNDLASRCGLRAVVKLTDERRRKATLQARRFTLDDWHAVFKAIEASTFLRRTNDRGWRVGFNFILSEANS